MGNFFCCCSNDFAVQEPCVANQVQAPVPKPAFIRDFVYAPQDGKEGLKVFPTAAFYKPADLDSTSALRVSLQQDYVFAAMFIGLCGTDASDFCKAQCFEAFQAALQGQHATLPSYRRAAQTMFESLDTQLMKAAANKPFLAGRGALGIVTVLDLRKGEVVMASVGGCHGVVGHTVGSFQQSTAEPIHMIQALLDSRPFFSSLTVLTPDLPKFQAEYTLLHAVREHVLGFGLVKDADLAAAYQRSAQGHKNAQRGIPGSDYIPPPDDPEPMPKKSRRKASPKPKPPLSRADRPFEEVQEPEPYQSCEIQASSHPLSAVDEHIIMLSPSALSLVSPADAVGLAHAFDTPHMQLMRAAAEAACESKDAAKQGAGEAGGVQGRAGVANNEQPQGPLLLSQGLKKEANGTAHQASQDGLLGPHESKGVFSVASLLAHFMTARLRAQTKWSKKALAVHNTLDEEEVLPEALLVAQPALPLPPTPTKGTKGAKPSDIHILIPATNSASAKDSADHKHKHAFSHNLASGAPSPTSLPSPTSASHSMTNSLSPKLPAVSTGSNALTISPSPSPSNPHHLSIFKAAEPVTRVQAQQSDAMVVVLALEWPVSLTSHNVNRMRVMEASRVSNPLAAYRWHMIRQLVKYMWRKRIALRTRWHHTVHAAKDAAAKARRDAEVIAWKELGQAVQVTRDNQVLMYDAPYLPMTPPLAARKNHSMIPRHPSNHAMNRDRPASITSSTSSAAPLSPRPSNSGTSKLTKNQTMACQRHHQDPVLLSDRWNGPSHPSTANQHGGSANHTPQSAAKSGKGAGGASTGGRRALHESLSASQRPAGGRAAAEAQARTPAKAASKTAAGTVLSSGDSRRPQPNNTSPTQPHDPKKAAKAYDDLRRRMQAAACAHAFQAKLQKSAQANADNGATSSRQSHDEPSSPQTASTAKSFRSPSGRAMQSTVSSRNAQSSVSSRGLHSPTTSTGRTF